MSEASVGLARTKRPRSNSANELKAKRPATMAAAGDDEAAAAGPRQPTRFIVVPLYGDGQEPTCENGACRGPSALRRCSPGCRRRSGARCRPSWAEWRHGLDAGRAAGRWVPDPLATKTNCHLAALPSRRRRSCERKRHHWPQRRPRPGQPAHLQAAPLHLGQLRLARTGAAARSQRERLSFEEWCSLRSWPRASSRAAPADLGLGIEDVYRPWL